MVINFTMNRKAIRDYVLPCNNFSLISKDSEVIVTHIIENRLFDHPREPVLISTQTVGLSSVRFANYDIVVINGVHLVQHIMAAYKT